MKLDPAKQSAMAELAKLTALYAPPLSEVERLAEMMRNAA